MTRIFKDAEAVPVSVIKIAPKEQLDEFKEGDKVKVTGLTKGHGFAGVVKRYSFAGGPKSHGQKNRFRAPGSIGATAPQRVVPGKKMAGRMGNVKKTILNLEIVRIDKENALLMLRGSVPGVIRGKLKLQKVS